MLKKIRQKETVYNHNCSQPPKQSWDQNIDQLWAVLLACSIPDTLFFHWRSSSTMTAKPKFFSADSGSVVGTAVDVGPVFRTDGLGFDPPLLFFFFGSAAEDEDGSGGLAASRSGTITSAITSAASSVARAARRQTSLASPAAAMTNARNMSPDSSGTAARTAGRSVASEDMADSTACLSGRL